MKKETLLNIITVVCMVAIVIFTAYYQDIRYKDKIDNYIAEIDSLKDVIEDKNYVILDCEEELNKVNDQMVNVIANSDSLANKLNLANFKLERIRYYNDVAKNGNNIKYLRGWINRVLNN